MLLFLTLSPISQNLFKPDVKNLCRKRNLEKTEIFFFEEFLTAHDNGVWQVIVASDDVNGVDARDGGDDNGDDDVDGVTDVRDAS